MESVLKELGDLNIGRSNPPVMKTFQRRKKKLGTIQDEETYSPVTTEESLPSPDVSPRNYSWMEQNLNKARRSSILPTPKPAEPVNRIKAKFTKAQWMAYKAFIRDRVQYFAEVDAYELAEESPDVKTAPRPDRNNRTTHDAAEQQEQREEQRDLAASDSDDEDDANNSEDPAAACSPERVTRRSSLTAATPYTVPHVSKPDSPVRKLSNISISSLETPASAANTVQHIARRNSLTAATPGTKQNTLRTASAARNLSTISSNSAASSEDDDDDEPADIHYDATATTVAQHGESDAACTSDTAADDDRHAAHDEPHTADAISTDLHHSIRLSSASLLPSPATNITDTHVHEVCTTPSDSIPTTSAAPDDSPEASIFTLQASPASTARPAAHTAGRATATSLAATSVQQHQQRRMSQQQQALFEDEQQQCDDSDDDAEAEGAAAQQWQGAAKRLSLASGRRSTIIPARTSLTAASPARQQEQDASADEQEACTPRRSSMSGILQRLRCDSSARKSMATAVKTSRLLQQQIPGLAEMDETQLMDLLASDAEEDDDESAASGSTQMPCHDEHEEVLTPLQQLLKLCGQDLEPCLAPDMDTLLRPLADLRHIIKISEGSYGEAFKGDNLVFKVVPMEGEQLVNGFKQSSAAQLLGEAIVGLTLSDLQQGTAQHSTPGFVHLHKVGVCRGRYSASLVRAWHAYDKLRGSENDPVGELEREQLYMLFAMEDCGQDLESAKLKDFKQARSMLLQVALALAVAEEACAFEHRDLHWGNVMVKPADSTTVSCRFRGLQVEVETEGIVVKLIDFTASRLQTAAGVVFFNMDDDPEIFEGKSKIEPDCCQFDTYRSMRKLTKSDWSGSYLATNCLWMHYLAQALLKKPGLTLSAGERRQLTAFKKRAIREYSCCAELIWDDLFQGCWLVQ